MNIKEHIDLYNSESPLPLSQSEAIQDCLESIVKFLATPISVNESKLNEYFGLMIRDAIRLEVEEFYEEYQSDMQFEMTQQESDEAAGFKRGQ